jgi:hypothetical protein
LWKRVCLFNLAHMPCLSGISQWKPHLTKTPRLLTKTYKSRLYNSLSVLESNYIHKQTAPARLKDFSVQAFVHIDNIVLWRVKKRMHRDQLEIFTNISHNLQKFKLERKIFHVFYDKASNSSTAGSDRICLFTWADLCTISLEDTSNTCQANF